ncbi:Vacuolar protein sorting-associated protein 13 [Saitoella coloradoensis]
MLEGLVAGLLNRFLGAYVQNFDPGQLNIGIWSGDVKLRNLQLRREALDKFKLPIDVKEGYLGSLTLQIPWSNLKGKPVKVLIEDVFLLANPKADQEYDEADEERRAQALKQEKLDSAELLGGSRTVESDPKDASFTDSLVTKIIDNLQVVVKNIHIRYEDTVSDPGHPFAVGATLSEFSAVSTDENWHEAFVQDKVETTHKLATLGSLAVYWNTDSRSLASENGAEVRSVEELIKIFGSLIAREGHLPDEHQYILKPVSGTGKINLNKIHKAGLPKTQATVFFEELGFVIDEEQYRDALMMLDQFHFFMRHQEYRKHRPNKSVKEDPKAWLRFAGDAILREVHEKHRRWTWAHFAERRDDRHAYVRLFKRKVQETIALDETDQLKDLEWKLSYKDIRFYRSLARRELRKERAEAGPIKKQAEKAQGWLGWVWGSHPKKEDENDTVMTEEQRKELYDAIEWNDNEIPDVALDLPPEQPTIEIHAKLKKGGFALKKDPHNKYAGANDILSVIWEGFGAGFKARQEGFWISLGLGSLKVYDGTTEGNVWPQIVKVKDEAKLKELEDKPVDGWDGHGEDPFFHMVFEKHPLDKRADSAVTARLKSTEIVYNPRCIETIARFLRPPAKNMESINALMEAAGATVEEIRNQTRAGLEFALEEHKTLAAKLDLQAPLIIIPESVTDRDADCIILDAGHIGLESDLVDKAKIREIQAKQKTQYTPEDWKELESLMYDQFDLSLRSTQLLIGPNVEDTLATLASDDQKHMHVVDRINMTFKVEMSILPKAPNLTRVRVSGHLPILHASMSDAKYKTMMRIIDVAIPHFDDDEKAAQKQRKASSARKPKTEGTRKRRPSFFGMEEPELIIDDASVTEVEDEEDENDDVDDDVFVDTDDSANTEESQIVHRKNFEFNFTVDKLQGSLYKQNADRRKPDELLVDIVLEHFALDFMLRPYDMVADVVLKTLHVEDRMDTLSPPEFRRLITSARVGAGDGGVQPDLVHIKYSKVDKDSPEFMTVYEGIDQNVDVKIATVNVIITRRSILTLLDFIVQTFTGGNGKQPPPRAIEDGDSSDTDSAVQEADGKIRVKVDLSEVIVILNHDGIRLATLTLSEADVGVFVMGDTLRVGARLGNLSLADDVNQGASATSQFRQLMSIEGDELADFRYETFDPLSPSYPGYDSSVYLRAGSLKVNFMEEPFRKIIDFGAKFAKMKAIIDAARMAAMNQAAQIQENASKMHFDILIRTPIVVFPRLDITAGQYKDLIIANLGEIYAKNQFAPLHEEEEGSPIVNKIAAGLRSIRLGSALYIDQRKQELDMIEDADITFNVVYEEHIANSKRPEVEVQGHMSDLNMRLTETQYKFLMELAQSIPRAFAPEPEDEDEELVELEEDEDVDPGTPTEKSASTRVDMAPELGAVTEGGKRITTWSKLDLVFSLNTVCLEIFQSSESYNFDDIDRSTLSKFRLYKTHVKMRMLTDGSIESELRLKSFTVKDTRKDKANKFREVIPAVTHGGSQFMASVTISGGDDKNMVVILTVDSPKIIFSLEYIFALKDYFLSAFSDSAGVSEAVDMQIEEAFPSTDASSTQLAQIGGTSQKTFGKNAPKPAAASKDEGGTNLRFRINVVDAAVILLANSAIANSEAIVLSMKQVIIAQEGIMALSVDQMGMYLRRMDLPEENRLRIVDDFNMRFTMDDRGSDLQQRLTSIDIDIEPLVLRVSLHDILLAVAIISKASELLQGAQATDEARKRARSLSLGGAPAGLRKRTASGNVLTAASRKPSTSYRTRTTSSTNERQSTDSDESAFVIKREILKASIDGLRLVLIGDLHELPMLDLCVKKFDVNVRDWSADLAMDTNIETYINVYNFSNSHWEPLLEPWQATFHMARKSNPDCLTIDLSSRKRMEMIVTSKTIATASKVIDYMSQPKEDILSKPRGTDAPYRIRNKTGHIINVWADAGAAEREHGSAVRIEDSAEVPWRFEDWQRMRENIRGDAENNTVSVKLEGTAWDTIQKVRITREGESLYQLHPDQQKYHLLCEVELGEDNVKYITFRSPLSIVNNTQVPIQMMVLGESGNYAQKVYTLKPGDSASPSIKAAYTQRLRLRPDPGLNYAWSTETLVWTQMLENITKNIQCKSLDPITEEGKQPPPFNFHAFADFDKSDPFTKINPYMTIRLSPPIEIQNLLPFDFTYRIYDKQSKEDWTNFLRKGGTSPVHVVQKSHLLLLSVDMEDQVYKPSTFAIVNSPDTEEYRLESKLVLADKQDLKLHLRIQYTEIPNSGGAYRASVYCPYIILNKTGLDVQVKSKSFLQSARVAAGQLRSSDGTKSAVPYMFSYHTDERGNRAVLKVGDSAWSKPQSFEAIGGAVEAVIPAASGSQEIHVGISVAAGEGKYKLTKVITLTPRFVLKNNLPETRLTCIMTLKSGEIAPLYFVNSNASRQLSLCFPGINSEWSAPISIQDLGHMHVKLNKEHNHQELVRSDVNMENATVFVGFSIESPSRWPIVIRNDSSTAFQFWQADPNSTEENRANLKPKSGTKVREIVDKSEMPYAWDYPAARDKLLVIAANNRVRPVRLEEIGNLRPMQLTPDKKIEINVVADGPTYVLYLSDYVEQESRYRPRESFSRSRTSLRSETDSVNDFDLIEANTHVNTKIQVRLEGIGVSLINSRLHELAYLTFRGIELQYAQSPSHESFNAMCKWIQIDNQLYGGIYPIILYPTKVPTTGKEMDQHPIFQAAMQRVKDDAHGVIFIKYATMLLQELSMEMDEDFLFALLDFTKVPGATWSEMNEGKLCDDTLTIPQPKSDASGMDLFFEILHIQPAQFNLSFVRTERVNAEDRTTSHNPVMFFLNVLTMALGNINDAPVRLDGLLMENLRVTTPMLVQRFTKHYGDQFLYQVHKILGSADFLGNPVGLFTNISSGVADVFYEPYKGFVMSDRPQDLGIGLAKGTASLVKKTVFGVTDSVSKFTGSISKGLAAATMDKQFQDSRRMSRIRNRPKHALFGVTAGADSFVRSVASGATGIVTKPMEGLQKGGAGGLFKGIGQGLVGMATKPMIGVFDLASNVTEGIRNTTTVFDENAIDRVRVPRYIGRDGVVRPYSQREAIGQQWLKQLNNGKFFDEEYLAHVDLPSHELVVMVTYNRIMLVRSRRVTTEWDISLRDLQTISIEKNGLSLILKGGVQGPFVPIPEQSARDFLKKKIGVAVAEFNSHHKHRVAR